MLSEIAQTHDQDTKDLVQALTILVSRSGGKVIVSEKEILDCVGERVLLFYKDELTHDILIAVETKASFANPGPDELQIVWPDTNPDGN